MRKSFQVEKQRHEIAVQRFALPLRDAAPRALEEFWGLRHTYDRAANAKWMDYGPSNFAGRATCLVVHPENPKLLYAGSAAGGLWKSVDAAESWTSCWPNALSQNIGAVAIDPNTPDTLICATGEGNLSTASYPGSGIYQSNDGGFTWSMFFQVPDKRRMTSQDRDGTPRRVCGISIGKTGSTGMPTLAFASISNDEQLRGGLFTTFPSPEFGAKFVTKWSTRPYNCYSVAFHPTEADSLYATIEAGGAVNGIWRSIKRGTDWEQLTNGLPPGELCGRISIAISHKDPFVMWALVSSRHKKLLGVFRYDRDKDTWINTATSVFANEGQLAFNNSIAIHPEDPDIVVCGGRGLYRTTNAGASWMPISSENRAISPAKRNPRYVHPDHHAIVMPGGDVIYSANDGGIAKSTDLGNTWQEASSGMSTVMFYALDVSPKNACIYGGGAQDNGALMAGVKAGVGLKRNSTRHHPFTQVLSGDGGYLVCDSQSEELVFASMTSTEMRRHDPGRRWAEGLVVDRWTKASPVVSQTEKDVLGLTVMAIKPPSGKQPRELILGTNRLWRSRNEGRSWQASLYQFDGSAVTAIEIASADSSIMFVGTARGGIFRSDNGGEDWSADLAGPEIPNRVITQIETHPKDARTLVVTVASSPIEAVALDGVPKTYSHVFRSTDAGRHWEDIDKGNLPSVVFNGLAFETNPPYRIFVAGDAGPWVSGGDGKWASIAGDMPSAVISDIVYHHKTRTLTAATYGRGIWRLKVPRHFQIAGAEPGIDANQLLPPIEGYFLDRAARTPTPLSPTDKATFNTFPRKTTFSCTPVRGAIGYSFETLTRDSMFQVASSPKASAQMDLLNPGTYTWRCWALFRGGRCSFPSDPRTFQYLV